MGPRSSELLVDFGRPTAVSVVRLSENIERGQSVAAYRVDGRGSDGVWKELSRGTTIGYAKLDRFQPTQVWALRLSVEDATATPEPIGLKAFLG
jgi:alpha-L-fucosidase